MVDYFLSKSPSETKKIGRELAKKIKKDGPGSKALILALSSDLGGGKTTFLQGLARGLGIEEKILSPTFVIMKRFKIPCSLRLSSGQAANRKDSKFENFYHLDCYRLKDAEELLELGFSEILFCPRNIVAIEWSEKIKKILPKSAVWIELKFINDKKRKITISK
ncbi:MAG: tRNA (adenosine(37)-N6)-threonylcarbamoyltransferase complex ATPase subunit type 1 TsaE [Parcubacteria group bacterium]